MAEEKDLTNWIFAGEVAEKVRDLKDEFDVVASDGDSIGTLEQVAWAPSEKTQIGYLVVGSGQTAEGLVVPGSLIASIDADRKTIHLSDQAAEVMGPGTVEFRRPWSRFAEIGDIPGAPFTVLP